MKKDIDSEKKTMIVVVAALLAAALILGSVFYHFVLTDEPAEITDVSYEMIDSERGKKLRLGVETEGGSWLGGGEPSYRYSTILGRGGSGGGTIWDERQDGEYVKYLGPYENGTEIWIMVSGDNKDDIEWEGFTVRIGGEASSSENGGLSVENVSNIPEYMGLKEEKEISVVINGTEEETEVNLHQMYAYRYDAFIGSGCGGGTGGGMIHPESEGENGEYRATISARPPGSDRETPSSYSGVLLFKVSSYDQNRSAVSQTYAVTLSE